MNLIRCLAGAILLLTVSHPSQADMITKDQLQSMFDGIKEKTPWDLNGKMLWGYFFTSSSKALLQPAADELKKKGYHFVEIREDENHLWWLHIELVEIHSVDSLDKRNQEFYSLADAMKISYDGMDVGPAPKETAEQGAAANP